MNEPWSGTQERRDAKAEAARVAQSRERKKQVRLLRRKQEAERMAALQQFLPGTGGNQTRWP